MRLPIDHLALVLIRLLLFSLVVDFAIGQPIDNNTAIDSSITRPERTLQFSYSYMNPVSYRGRTFGIHQFGIMPQITYQNSTNWRIYSAGYIWNDFQTADFGKLDLGIDKEGTLGKHLTYTLGYEHWFFPGDDDDERPPLNNFFDVCLSGEWHDWNPSVSNYYMVGREQLLQTDVALSRYVGLAEGAGWSLFVEPLAKATLSNQNSIVNGIFQAQPADKLNHSGSKMRNLRRAYGLVAAEVSLPITLQRPRWSILIDPRLVKPFNTLPGERTKVFFYAVATLTYILHLGHGH